MISFEDGCVLLEWDCGSFVNNGAFCCVCGGI